MAASTAPIVMPEGRLLRLWGKTGEAGSFHPAVFHMLDVGNVARELLGPDGPARFRLVLTRALAADDPHTVEAWLPLLVALHDIGKISAPFQGATRRLATRLQRERLEQEGFTFGRTLGATYPHQHITADFVGHVWPELEADVPTPLIRALRDALGGHHGSFADSADLRKTHQYLQYDEPEEWSELRRAAYQFLRARIGPPPTDRPPLPVPEHRRAATLALTGFTILCDWLGSDERYFSVEPLLSVETYPARSQARASSARGEAGFSSRADTPYSSFSALFPGVPAPRPVQQAIDCLPASIVGRPALFIIEAPTGEGKTEAALALARRIAAARGSDELYFGLPTTATSNQMFGRVHEFVSRVVGEGAGVKLIHGQASLAEDDLLLRLQGDVNEGSAVAVSEWFAPKKRALLAPFGVGTVDQVELASLNARHYMLRLFGLAGKTVIIDEVHAYDAYMSTILEHTLCWLSALGSSVILLSATLPAERHAALAATFSRAEEEDLRSDPLPYPCIAAYTREESVLEPVDASQPNRSLRCQFIADKSVEQQCRRLLDLIAEGGAVCRLCNTVAEAQELFRVVDELAPPDVYRVLLHSRFPADERRVLEEQVTALFGPSSARSPTERFIVIGTQVLEQSLDLDFDVMVSDFAPIDLLLQRAGRLHRHPRVRPDAHVSPVLWIQLPRTGGMPSFGPWKHVYDEYILWTSFLTLEGRLDGDGGVDVNLPGDYRPLIESAYPRVPPALPGDHPYRVALAAAHGEYMKRKAHHADEARLRLIPSPDPTAGIGEGRKIEFEEDSDGGKSGWSVLQTRLGPESVTVIPLYRQAARLSIDPAGTEPLGPGCPRPVQLRLLQRSIPLPITPGRQPMVNDLRAAREALQWFRDAPLLRSAVPLVLDGGEARAGETIITLDPRLGLVARKEMNV